MATPPATTDTKRRSFSMSIDIDATPEEVWRALTDAGELMRWFPLQARVTPGKGGSVFWGWDEHWAWESQIDAWEPGARLRLVENRPAFDVNGEPLPGPPEQLAMEFTLDTHAGKTTLRIVHSGFGDGGNWDDELESVSAGWQFELRGLKHYLEHHKGRDRHHAATHAVTALSIDEVWKRLLSPAAFAVTDGALVEGGRVVIRAATGDQLAGTVAWHNPGHDLVRQGRRLRSRAFSASAPGAPAARPEFRSGSSAYTPKDAARVREFGVRTKALVERLFR